MNGSEATQLTSCDIDNMVNVVRPNFIHTTHVHIIQNMLFYGRKVNSDSHVTFCNIYFMLFSCNTIMALNDLLGVISQPNLMCN